MDGLTVRTAKVRAGLVSAASRSLALLLFILGDFFVTVGIRIAGSKHGIRTPGLLFLLAHGAKLVAHLANGTFDGFYFDEQVAHFLEKIVQVEGAQDIGRAGQLQGANVLVSTYFGHQIKDADAPSLFVRNAGQLAKRDEYRGIRASQRNISDNQGPFDRFERGKEQVGVLNQADSPAL